MLVLFDVQAKKQYEKAFRDWEKVQEAHLKIEQDVTIPRIDVEKVSSSCLELLLYQICAHRGWPTWSGLGRAMKLTQMDQKRPDLVGPGQIEPRQHLEFRISNAQVRPTRHT